MILEDERIDLDTYLAEVPRRLDVLRVLSYEERMSVEDLARRLNLDVETAKNLLRDVEAMGLVDTREELDKGRITLKTRLSNRGVRYLRSKGLL